MAALFGLVFAKANWADLSADRCLAIAHVGVINLDTSMALYRSTVSEPSYPASLKNTDIRTFEVYTTQSDRLGQVNDVLLDHAGQAYLGMDVGFWDTGKQVLLPLERCQIHPSQRRITVRGLLLSQVPGLPTYNSADVIDRAARTEPVSASRMSVLPPLPDPMNVVVENSAPLESSLPLESDVTLYPEQTIITRSEGAAESAPQPAAQTVAIPQPAPRPVPNPEPVSAPAPVSQSQVAIAANETVRLLGERVVVDARRQKVGEVIVRKEIETQIVEVPVRRERLIVEQVSPERKQLVNLDLGQQSIPDILLTDLDIAPPASASPIPVEIASRFLAEAAKHERYKNIKVHVKFEDKALQSSYQQWVNRYHSAIQSHS